MHGSVALSHNSLFLYFPSHSMPSVCPLLSLLENNVCIGSSVTVSIQDAPLDCQRMKRHIALFCDRILKGGTLSRPGQKEANEEKGMGATQSLSHSVKSRPAIPEVHVHCICTQILYISQRWFEL